jgi:biopolymer transport protein TolQ
MTPFLLLAVTPAAAEPTVLEWFWRSGPMAKIVLFVLLTFSVVSWTIMIAKRGQLRKAEQQNQAFLKAFHQSSRFSEVNAVAERFSASPLIPLFRAGYGEIDAQIKAAGSSGGVAADGSGSRPRYRIRSVTAVERSLRRRINEEVAKLTRGTPFLATTAAATPFIGLFGTVWGIMVAFQDIGASGSTSIVAVAPGIAEALINTTAGLAAAIPALIGYNYFAQKIRDQRNRMEDFLLELVNLAERNFT